MSEPSCEPDLLGASAGFTTHGHSWDSVYRGLGLLLVAAILEMPILVFPCVGLLSLMSEPPLGEHSILDRPTPNSPQRLVEVMLYLHPWFSLFFLSIAGWRASEGLLLCLDCPGAEKGRWWAWAALVSCYLAVFLRGLGLFAEPLVYHCKWASGEIWLEEATFVARLTFEVSLLLFFRRLARSLQDKAALSRARWLTAVYGLFLVPALLLHAWLGGLLLFGAHFPERQPSGWAWRLMIFDDPLQRESSFCILTLLGLIVLVAQVRFILAAHRTTSERLEGAWAALA